MSPFVNLQCMLSEELTIFTYQKISNNYLRESHPVKFINQFFSTEWRKCTRERPRRL